MLDSLLALASSPEGSSSADRGRGYRVYPTSRDPRWLLPADAPLHRAGLRLYAPQRLLGRLRKAGMRFRLGGEDVALADPLLTELEGRFCEVLGAKEVRLAFFAGTPGAFRKATVHVMAPDGRPLAYAKAASTPRARSLVENEEIMLERLLTRPRLAPHLPSLLGSFESHDCRYLVVSCGPMTSAPSRLERSHLRLLDTIAAEFGGRLPFAETTTYGSMVRRFNDLPLPEHWRERYATALQVVESNLAGDLVWTTLGHGDFAPWNTRVRGDGELYVFDWEFARADALATSDFFHFVVMAELHLRRPLNSNYVRELLDHPWLVRTGRPQAYFLAFLLDLGLAYHEMLFARSGSEDDAVLRQVAALIDDREEWWTGP